MWSCHSHNLHRWRASSERANAPLTSEWLLHWFGIYKLPFRSREEFATDPLSAVGDPLEKLNTIILWPVFEKPIFCGR